MIRHAGVLLLASALPCLAQEGAEALRLIPPIACDIVSDCHIQQYVDRDPGPGWRDFTCGGLAYDGHTGTDFALPSLARMAAGVDVLASASGTVVALRDGMADGALVAGGSVDGTECGNGVVIRHAGGWETQYCHLRQGSVVVTKGQAVKAGDVLGLVGMSGAAEFPHVHLSVRRNGAVVDPFAPADLATCGAGGDTLWADAVAYEPGGLIALGFATAVPDYAAIKAGTAGADTIAPDAPALVLWAHGYGARPGDVIRLVIEGPNQRWFDTDVTLDKPQAQYFRAAGRKASGLPPGTWRGIATLVRNGQDIDRRETTITIAN